jgi:hypothetical protein
MRPVYRGSVTLSWLYEGRIRRLAAFDGDG